MWRLLILLGLGAAAGYFFIDRMNKEQLKGNWQVLSGRIKQRWSLLTDDELMHTQGKLDELVGAIQRSYGGAKDEIRRQVQALSAT